MNYRIDERRFDIFTAETLIEWRVESSAKVNVRSKQRLKLGTRFCHNGRTMRRKSINSF